MHFLPGEGTMDSVHVLRWQSAHVDRQQNILLLFSSSRLWTVVRWLCGVRCLTSLSLCRESCVLSLLSQAVVVVVHGASLDWE